MSVIALAFDNKNQYRKYPLKQSCTFQSDDGFYLPDNLLVNCSITSVYGRHRLYIKQIFHKNNTTRITVASVYDDVTVGVFAGEVLENFTTLTLTPFIKYLSGNLTIGSRQSLASIGRVLNFSKESTELEESTIFCYTPPGVTSISDSAGHKLHGRVNLGVLTNIQKTNTTHGVAFQAINPESISNPADKSSLLGNCPTPMIKTINGVVPFPNPQNSAEASANNGNIYIVGVEPVVFYGRQDQPGVVQVTTIGITLDSLCTEKHKLLPPVDISGFTIDSAPYRDMYYSKPEFTGNSTSPNYPYTIPRRLASNFNNTSKPEFYYWPQFVNQGYYSYWNLPPE